MTVRAVDYGDWQHWTAPGFGPEQLVARVAEHIAAAQPDGELRLLGYSVGGHLGFATIQRLRQMGRTVGLLGILDTNLSEHPHSGFRTDRHDPATETGAHSARPARRRGRGTSGGVRRKAAAGAALVTSATHPGKAPGTRACQGNSAFICMTGCGRGGYWN